MNSLHLINSVKAFKKHPYDFGGVITNDNKEILKSVSKNNFFFISNTLSSYEASQVGHWILIFVKNSTLFFVDSYAMDPYMHGGVLTDFFYCLRMLNVLYLKGLFNIHPPCFVEDIAYFLLKTCAEICLYKRLWRIFQVILRKMI